MVFVLPLQLFLSTSLEFNYGFCVPLQKRSCASHLSLSVSPPLSACSVSFSFSLSHTPERSCYVVVFAKQKFHLLYKFNMH